MNSDIDRMSYGPDLEIAGLQALKAIARDIGSNEDIPKQIVSIKILDLEDQEDQEIIQARQRKKSNCQVELCAFCQNLIFVIRHVVQHGDLQSFSWPTSSLDDIEHTRPESFWQALSVAAPTLKELNLGFYPHEILYMGFMLKSLTLGLHEAHGDDASMIDRMLQNIHELELLSLELPMCDLEHCRIRGLTYSYNFPKLKTFEISAYLDANAGFTMFLSRHSSITSLTLNVDGDEPLRIPKTFLPNLSSLSLGSAATDPDLMQIDLLFPSSGRPIRHLRIRRSLGAHGVDLVVLPPSLRCLEVNNTSWREDQVQRSVQELLLQLTWLEELDVTFQSSSIINQDETGVWRHAAALSVDDLCRILSYLPPDSRIRAVKMTDDRSAPLPDTFLGNIPPIPKNLSFLGWTVNGNEVLYELQRKDDEIIVAVECERIRGASTGSGAHWTENSILNHLG